MSPHPATPTARDHARPTPRSPRLADATRAAAAARHGLVTESELRADGLSVAMIDRLTACDVLTSVQPKVYRLPGSAPSFESRCAAVCLAFDDAVITGPAAARLWGFGHVFEVRVPEVSTSASIVRGASTHSTGPAPESNEVHTRSDAIRVTTPARTWFDCARHLTDDRFELLTHWVIERDASAVELHATARRLDRRGQPGTGRVHRVLSRRASWQRPARSGLERRVVRALRRRGFVGLTGSHRVDLRDGHAVHLTAADRSVRWAVEVDHVRWHGGRFSAARERGRVRRVREVGWDVVRVTDDELDRDFGSEIGRLARSLTERRGASSAA